MQNNMMAAQELRNKAKLMTPGMMPHTAGVETERDDVHMN